MYALDSSPGSILSQVLSDRGAAGMRGTFMHNCFQPCNSSEAKDIHSSSFPSLVTLSWGLPVGLLCCTHPSFLHPKTPSQSGINSHPQRCSLMPPSTLDFIWQSLKSHIIQVIDMGSIWPLNSLSITKITCSGWKQNRLFNNCSYWENTFAP